jgi:hypothetical protein
MTPRPKDNTRGQQRRLVWGRALGRFGRGGLGKNSGLPPCFPGLRAPGLPAWSTAPGHPGVANSLSGEPAIRVWYITLAWLISHGMALWSKHRLSQITASPGVQLW